MLVLALVSGELVFRVFLLRPVVPDEEAEFQQLLLDHQVDWLVEIEFVPPHQRNEFLRLEPAS